MAKSTKPTTAALEILYGRFYEGKPAKIRDLEDARRSSRQDQSQSGLDKAHRSSQLTNIAGNFFVRCVGDLASGALN